MGQSWSNLLFAHWPVARERLEEVVPPQLPLDEFDRTAWIGITPFRVESLRLRGMPPLPWLSFFPELNVRTYVTVDGKPGIYFFSLDAGRRSAVISARRVYRLPYFHAEMARHAEGEHVRVRSRRISDDGPEAAFRSTYRAAGPATPARPGSLEYFLTERYCLYTLDERQRVLRGEIHHRPWPLQNAEAEVQENSMARPFGVALEGSPLLHFSAHQDVVLWRNEPVEIA
jgi:uncharacterized protein YqjF (DUF2071 family)